MEDYREKILKLEKEIACFFGVLQPEFVAQHYIEAIKLLDRRNEFTPQELKTCMLSHLEAAYAEVKKQTCLVFDVKKAAALELELFIATSEQASFETEYAILVNIYNEVFGTITHQIQNAALLRTFLYRYKNQLMSSGRSLSDNDIDFLKYIAEKTERELNMLNPDSESCVRNDYKVPATGHTLI